MITIVITETTKVEFRIKTARRRREKIQSMESQYELTYLKLPPAAHYCLDGNAIDHRGEVVVLLVAFGSSICYAAVLSCPQ